MSEASYALSTLEKAVDDYQKSGRETRKPHEVDASLLDLIKGAASEGDGNLAVAAARLWHRGRSVSSSEVDKLLETDRGNDEVPPGLDILFLRQHVHDHIVYRTYRESLGLPPVDEDDPPTRGNPDLGNEGLDSAEQDLYEKTSELRDEFFSRGLGSEWLARNDHEYLDYETLEERAAADEEEYPSMPTFEDRPVKDAKTVTPKSVAPSMDQAEVRAALPPGVGLKGSGYDRLYQR